MALEGHAADACDMAAPYARQQQIFGARTPYYAWFYPPFLLFIATPLALLPYPAALILWQAVTLAFYVGVMRHRRHFATDPPIATRSRLSPDIARAGGLDRHVAQLLLQNGDVGFEKLQSTFAVVRMWGGGIPLAYIAQGAISIAAVCGVAWTWRGSCDFNTKAALLTIATLLASPHTLDYDLMILGPAIAFVACAGFAGGVRSFEISLLAAAWIVPLLSRIIAGVTGIPLGLLVLLALYVFTLQRAVRDHLGSVIEIRRIAQA